MAGIKKKKNLICLVCSCLLYEGSSPLFSSRKTRVKGNRLNIIEADRKNNHAASKNKPSKQGKAFFTGSSSEYLNSRVYYLDSIQIQILHVKVI